MNQVSWITQTGETDIIANFLIKERQESKWAVRALRKSGAMQRRATSQGMRASPETREGLQKKQALPHLTNMADLGFLTFKL